MRSECAVEKARERDRKHVDDASSFKCRAVSKDFITDSLVDFFSMINYKSFTKYQI